MISVQFNSIQYDSAKTAERTFKDNDTDKKAIKHYKEEETLSKNHKQLA